MGCTECGEHRHKQSPRTDTRAIVEIENPEKLVLFRTVKVPASLGDDTTYPPTAGKYENVLLTYEANGHAYLYSSDGIPSKLTSDVAEDLSQRIDSLSSSLSLEAEARSNGDTSLQGQVDSLDNALDKTVMSDLAVNANPSTTTIQLDAAKVNLKTSATSTTNISLPVASTTQAGVMNSAIYNAVSDNTSRLNAISSGAVAISGIGASPSQADLTIAWKAETGLTELINRATIYDVTNDKIWTYYSNDDTWHATSSAAQVLINQFTNTSPGTIQGSTNVGQIFAENDGTGSVNGWDTLSDAVANNTSSKLAVNNLLASGGLSSTVAGSGANTTVNVSISDGGVTNSKLANNSVTSSKIADFGVPAIKMGRPAYANVYGAVRTVVVPANGDVLVPLDVSVISDNDFFEVVSDTAIRCLKRGWVRVSGSAYMNNAVGTFNQVRVRRTRDSVASDIAYAESNIDTAATIVSPPATSYAAVGDTYSLAVRSNQGVTVPQGYGGATRLLIEYIGLY